KYDWPAVSIETTDQGDYFEVTTGELRLKIKKHPLSIQTYNQQGKLLSSGNIGPDQTTMSRAKDSVIVRRKLFSGEHFFGFGERMAFVDQRGRKLRLNVGRGSGPSHLVGAYNILEANYSPVPFFMSTRGYGIFFHTPYATQWDMGHTQSGQYS